MIHNSFDFLPLTYSRLTATPVITTIHGFSSPGHPAGVRQVLTTAHLLRRHQRRRQKFRPLDYVATIHHGIDIGAFTFNSTAPESYLAFFGRIHPDKEVVAAIEAAGRARIPLPDSRNRSGRGVCSRRRSYHDLTGERVQFCRIRSKPRIARRSSARCSCSPPFDRLRRAVRPLGSSRAMACGTPVIGFDRGSMSELIVEGTTGYCSLPDVESGAADAATKIVSLLRPVQTVRALARSGDSAASEWSDQFTSTSYTPGDHRVASAIGRGIRRCGNVGMLANESGRPGIRGFHPGVSPGIVSSLVVASRRQVAVSA